MKSTATGRRQVIRAVAAGLACALQSVAGATAAAQPGPPDAASATVSAAERRRVIDGAIQRLGRYYVFPDSVDAIARALRNRARGGAYDGAASGPAFAALLTEDLKRFGHDPHLRVEFSAVPVTEALGDSGLTAAERDRRERTWVESFRAEGEAFNDYVYNVDRLSGNVGYLRLGAFFPWALAGPRITAAMDLLARTDAVIIDLRHSGGGDPETVARLQGYFVESRTFGGTRVDRVSGRTDSTWITPTPGNEHFRGKPLYILTSGEIYSAPEAFAYGLQALGRATVVGEVTRGGAHVSTGFRIDGHFSIVVPHSRSMNAITGTDWEGTGVKPDVAVPADQALRQAQLLALRRLGRNGGAAHPSLVDERQRAIDALSRALEGPAPSRGGAPASGVRPTTTGGAPPPAAGHDR